MWFPSGSRNEITCAKPSSVGPVALTPFAESRLATAFKSEVLMLTLPLLKLRQPPESPRA